MPEFVVVLCTCRDQQEALHMANALIERRLAACVNVLPSLQSIYRWQDKIEVDTEHLLLIKTTQERFEALRDAIIEMHSYETPEILALAVVAGTEKYLSWIRESV